YSDRNPQSTSRFDIHPVQRGTRGKYQYNCDEPGGNAVGEFHQTWALAGGSLGEATNVRSTRCLADALHPNSSRPKSVDCTRYDLHTHALSHRPALTGE